MVYKHCVRHKFSNTEFALFCIFQKKTSYSHIFQTVYKIAQCSLTFIPSEVSENYRFSDFCFLGGAGGGGVKREHRAVMG